MEEVYVIHTNTSLWMKPDVKASGFSLLANDFHLCYKRK